METKQQVVEAAKFYASNGMSVVPTMVSSDPAKDKRPTVSWTEYQSVIPDGGMIDQWYAHPDAAGVAIVCGAVSGGLEMLDFDFGGEALPEFRKRLEAKDKPLLLKLVAEKSKNGGCHIPFRSAEPDGNLKLCAKRVE